MKKKNVLLLVAFIFVSMAAFCQTTFRPVKATISDNQGTFTSTNFNCASMSVSDKGTSVTLSWGGENIPLYKDKYSPDTYSTSQSKNGITMKFVAYRSSNTKKIYLVICTTIEPSRRTDIHFKP